MQAELEVQTVVFVLCQLIEKVLLLMKNKTQRGNVFLFHCMSARFRCVAP